MKNTARCIFKLEMSKPLYSSQSIWLPYSSWNDIDGIEASSWSIIARRSCSVNSDVELVKPFKSMYWVPRYINAVAQLPADRTVVSVPGIMFSSPRIAWSGRSRAQHCEEMERISRKPCSHPVPFGVRLTIPIALPSVQFGKFWTLEHRKAYTVEWFSDSCPRSGSQ